MAPLTSLEVINSLKRAATIPTFIPSDTNFPSNVFIFISSLSFEITEQKAYEAGADVFIAKPFNVASLDARIRQLLDVRTAINIRKELIIDPKETLITSDDDKFVANIINVIEDNIADVEFNIDKLASLLNISRSTLYRRAMEITNLSPSDLIRKRRMRRAAELLKQTSHPVSEICYMVGYSDQRYFGQSFKKEFGMQPSEYMERFTSNGTVEDDVPET